MPMTVVVTREAPDRFRGFLASVMLELAPGVYTAPRMSAAVRERVWEVLVDWHRFAPLCGVVMTWPDATHPAGQVVATLGFPKRMLVNLDGIHLSHRPLKSADVPF
jgi:CRISPR-associated protein Cas2